MTDNNQTVSIKLAIEGMNCEHCVASVTESFSEIEGVTSVAVDLESKSGVVEYDSAIVALDAVMAALEDTSFTATVVS